MSLLAHAVLKSSLARRIVRRVSRGRVPVIMYHGVTSSPLPVYNWCHMSAAEFRAQAEWLKANCRVLPLAEVVSRLGAHRPMPESAACITFDDGFRSVASHAAPILEKLGLPFTVFIVTGLRETGAAPWPERIFAALLGSAQETVWWNDRTCSIRSPEERKAFYAATIAGLVRLPSAKRQEKADRLVQRLGEAPSEWTAMFSTLTQPELAAITASGLCSLGAHSNTHAILTLCTDEELRRELEVSRRTLAGTRGYCDILAYPNGDHNAAVTAAARETGFRGAVTVEHRLCRAGDDPFAVPRVGIASGLPTDAFEIKILGY